MNNKNIIIAGAIAIGLYLFSQTKKITNTTTAQKVAQRTRSTATPTVRKRTAQKIAQKVAQKVAQKAAQKVDISKLPVQQLRYMIAHAAVLKKTGKEVAALKAEVARREAAWLAAHKVAQKRTGVPISRTAYLAALRKRAAQKIGKIIGKKVAQKVDISKLPARQLRYMIAHAAVQNKTGKEVAALKAEVARREAAWLAAHKVAQKRIGVPITRTAYLAAQRKRGAQNIGKIIGKIIGKKVAQKVVISKLPVQQLRYMIAHAAALKKTGKEVAALKAEVKRREAAWSVAHKVAHKVARKVAQKKVASWKAPYKFRNSKFRVITPSDLLKNLAKKDIARKKVVQQKKVQKTTSDTPSDRRKSRLEALYGSHWHDIWLKRQKRR